MPATPRTIVLSVLENDFEQFAARLKTIEQFAPLVEIDVMDGIFVNNQSFTGIEKINELETPVKFQLHLMVDDPLAEIEKWKKIKNISRVIFHLESKSDPLLCLNAIRANCWQAGIALKTDTPLSTAEPYYNLVDVVMFMLVPIGRQGGQLVTEVGKKIREFAALEQRPLCAIDGGINKNNVQLIKNWGVEIFGIGSAIVRAENPGLAYQKFLSIIQK